MKQRLEQSQKEVNRLSKFFAYVQSAFGWIVVIFVYSVVAIVQTTEWILIL